MEYIFVKLMGGLGNQLFQYAASFLLQTIHSGKIILIKAENDHDTFDYRSIFNKGLIYNVGIPQIPTVYQEDGFGVWNPNNYNQPMILLHGYFQNYSVLKSILVDFKKHILNVLEPYRNNTIILNSGFIHVRRGDYLNKSDIHHIQSLEYYKKALEIFKHINHWYIFSDDLQWCKQQTLFSSLNITYVDKTPIETLAMMSQIHNAAIIANSSFSWWGAYLGVDTIDCVVYPKQWFSDKTPDLFPEHWVEI